MRLIQSIASSRAGLITAFAGAVMTLGVGRAALAQDSSQVPAASANLPGKHVILRVGPGFNPISADGIARVLRQDGCPATVTAERGFPGHLTVDIEGYKPSKFKSGEVGAAGLVAKRLCLGD